MLHCYRHIAPLEQDEQLIQVLDAINLKTLSVLERHENSQLKMPRG
jgi:hypothetical protein